MFWRIAFTTLSAAFLAVVSSSLSYGVYLLHRGPRLGASTPQASVRVMPSPDTTTSTLWQARQHLDAGEVEQAILTYRLVLARGPIPEAQLGLAEGERLAGREDVAVKEFERALDLAPGNAIALRALAGLYARRRETWALAEARYRDLLERHDQDADAQLALARLLVWQGKLPAAAELFSPLAVQARMTPEDRRHHGFALARAGRASEAETVLTAAMQANPGDHAVVLQLAGLRSRRGDWSGAVPLYRSLLQHRPRDASLLLSYGTGLVALRQCAAALGPLGIVRKARRDDVDAMLAHARALRDCGHGKEAAKEFDRGRKRRPFDARLTREYADVLMQQGNHGKAADMYRRALSLGLRDRRLLAALGAALTAKGKHREAEPYLVQARN